MALLRYEQIPKRAACGQRKREALFGISVKLKRTEDASKPSFSLTVTRPASTPAPVTKAVSFLATCPHLTENQGNQAFSSSSSQPCSRQAALYFGRRNSVSFLPPIYSLSDSSRTQKPLYLHRRRVRSLFQASLILGRADNADLTRARIVPICASPQSKLTL